jgi:hypothetical protein
MSLHNIRHDTRFLLLFYLTADILENLVHFLEGSASSFGDKKEREQECQETEDRKESICACARVLDQRRCYETLCQY